uniref:Uncharacterized protein n=1 Tax=Anguilla anguilla TaxID=7936 RepID=A0A0E9VFL6_ANGAN
MVLKLEAVYNNNIWYVFSVSLNVGNACNCALTRSQL